MEHTIELATSGRAKCRGCGEALAKGELRFGERVENPYGEGPRTLWFHLACGAYLRSEPFLSAAAGAEPDVPQLDRLCEQARAGVEHRRLARVSVAQAAPTGRARCRACRDLIEKDAWRIALVFWEEARFSPSGFIHARCARDYLETADVMPRVMHFSPKLTSEELEAVRLEVEQGSNPV